MSARDGSCGRGTCCAVTLSPGQIDYERFCEREYRQLGRVWNRWETLPHEEKASWEAGAMRWGPQA